MLIIENLHDLKLAIEMDKKIHWQNPGYSVVKNQKSGEAMIKCANGDCQYLFHADGDGCSYDPKEFYIEE